MLGWRVSEWTGSPRRSRRTWRLVDRPERDRPRARVYGLAALELDTDADALAFDREPADIIGARSWSSCICSSGRTPIARREVYEEADRFADRIAHVRLTTRSSPGLVAKIDREEVTHRLHAELWAVRLQDEPRFRDAVEELWPYALGVVGPELREEFGATRRARAGRSAHERNGRTPEFAELWEDDDRSAAGSAPGAQW